MLSMTQPRNKTLVYQPGAGKPVGDPNDPNFAGMPSTPVYNPTYDPNSMDLTGATQAAMDNIDTSGLKKSVQGFSDQANRPGASPWAMMANQQQDAEMRNELERGAGASNAGTAGAMNQLASSGGLTSGARERAAEGGAKNLVSMTQDAGRQNSLNKMQIGVNDEQNKMQEMGMLPGMQAAALEPDFRKAGAVLGAQSQAVENEMRESNNVNNWNQGLYGQQMAGWSAAKQSDAIAHSGKKGGS